MELNLIFLFKNIYNHRKIKINKLAIFDNNKSVNNNSNNNFNSINYNNYIPNSIKINNISYVGNNDK